MKHLFDLKQKEQKLNNSIKSLNNRIKRSEDLIHNAWANLKYADNSQQRDQDMRFIKGSQETLDVILNTLQEKETLLKETQEEIRKAKEFFEKQPDLF